MRLINRSVRTRKGAVVAEYGVLLAGILVVSLAAISMGGHKIGDLWGVFTAIIPGAHLDDNAPLSSGQLIETKLTNGEISIDDATIATETNNERLGDNLGVKSSNLVKPPPPPAN